MNLEFGGSQEDKKYVDRWSFKKKTQAAALLLGLPTFTPSS